jgi:hypothetical protein
LNRKLEQEVDDELEEWEPFLHHRNRALRKSGGEHRHIDHEDSGQDLEKRKRKIKRTPEVFD